jgi:signal transduction histidine kinase
MPGISQRRFYATVRGPSAEALTLLAKSSDDILTLWNREVHALGLQPHDLLTGVPFNFLHFADLLRKSPYATFRQRVQEIGGKLARRGVELSVAVAAMDRLFEICLAALLKTSSKRATPVLALARLNALMGLLVISGYTGQWAAGKKTLVEASLAEAEDRRYDASAYVTKIYEQERRRLSHDLHDEVGHDLILLKMHLEMIAMEPNSHAVQTRVREAISLVSNAIDSVRRLVLDLGPAVFDELGFLPAVKSYINQFSSRTRIQVDVEADYLPPEIPSTHQIALYRILQGALSNVVKHASATRVRVFLGARDASMLIMEVEDNGVGFDPEAKPKRESFGLTAMRERVEVLGGTIQIQSRRASAAGLPSGTKIHVELPLPGGEGASASVGLEPAGVDSR